MSSQKATPIRDRLRDLLSAAILLAFFVALGVVMFGLLWVFVEVFA